MDLVESDSQGDPPNVPPLEQEWPPEDAPLGVGRGEC